MRKEYEAPEIRELGSFDGLTLQDFNKCGPNSDNPQNQAQNIIGSLVPVPPYCHP
jgi:hypothetical protein